MKEFDFLIIGGGLFGVYTALHLADKKYSVCIIEKEKQLLSKASIVNQCRLHSGYHYPRSITTAKMAAEHKERFVLDHRQFINTEFESYYAIEKNSSTNGNQFERFCKHIGIPAKRIGQHPLIHSQSLEAIYLTSEYSFDTVMLAEFYKEKINAHKNISLILNTTAQEANVTGNKWEITCKNPGAADQQLRSSIVINASYAGTNVINSKFGIPPLPLEYEISEIALIQSGPLSKMSLTVIDGPFVSTVPYGNTAMQTLTSVLYTHHHVSDNTYPRFSCQKLNTLCKPDFLSLCTSCTARPESNQKKMIAQLKKYLASDVPIQYLHSLYTIKTKLKSSYIDDGRPTEISKLSDSPPYYCIFSGKINSIYEIEKLFADVF